MKGLIWNCQSVIWGYPGEKPKKASDCLLVYICCEKGDTLKTAKDAARRILQVNKKRYLRNSLVVFPFSHLSNHILRSDIAEKLINDIREILLEEKLKVEKLRFNYNKELKIHLCPTNKDVTYFCY